jgi:toxin ParE1/3/4
MYNVRLSQLAEHDLEDIWLYTFNAWSYQQADKYQDELYEGVLRLAGDVNLGIAADHIRPGYRKYKVGRHLIFYLFSETDKSIFIVRILHESMDLPRRLL